MDEVNIGGRWRVKVDGEGRRFVVTVNGMPVEVKREELEMLKAAIEKALERSKAC